MQGERGLERSIPGFASGSSRVEFKGHAELLEQLKDPLRRALERRRAFYRVEIEAIGRCGEVVVVIDGSKGRVPLLFGHEELEPAYVVRVVEDTVDKFGL
jgi:hypothetical protein